MKIESLMKGVLYVLLTICGFFLVKEINSTNESISHMNRDLVEIRIQVTQLSEKMITEERVKEIVKLELLKMK